MKQPSALRACPRLGCAPRWTRWAARLKVEQIAYQNGRPRPPQLQVRYEYASAQAPAPSLIERPSVIPGKVHTTRISYNAAGQVTRITEEGFSPLDAQGQVATAPGNASAISRSTSYTYQTINGRSVLAAMDGPLPNGPGSSPADSDITTFAYDARADYLVGMTQPGSRKSTLTYDAAGRIATVQNAEGFSTAFTFDAMQLIQTRSSGPGWAKPNIQTFKYDALGQPAETGTGSEADNSYRPQTRQSFDALGRLQWQASALGMLTQNRFDTESQLIETGRYSNAIAQIENTTYDSEGRLQSTWNNRGAGFSLHYNAQGGIERITDALGRSTPSANTRNSSPRNASPRTRPLTDDFGRIVMTASPDSGTTTRGFDEADRMTASTDAQGNSAQYAYDLQGRIQKQTIRDAATQQSSQTTWVYSGQRLVALNHPSQSERYAYDERGLRIAKIVTLHSKDGPQGQPSATTAVTRYTFDDAGILQSTQLPDGSRLVYERNAQGPTGQVTALKRSQLQTPWLQRWASWMLPAPTIVQDLRRDLIGIKSYTTGNGIQAQYQRSQNGALARVVYRHPTQALRSSATAGLMGATTQETISWLLGVTPAQAAEPVQTQAALLGESSKSAVPGALPGALGLPQDPQALIDHRYLWDTAGNLLYAQGKSAGLALQQTSYAYDRQDRLIVASQGQVQEPAAAQAVAVSAATNTSRYHYSQGRRVLVQENISDAQDLKTGTRQVNYQTATHRWLGDDAAPAQYNANGQPETIGRREYVWDALGRLAQVRQESNASAPGKTIASYTYNHRGERISKTAHGKTVQGKTTHYLYEDGQLSAELNEQGQITRQYLYLAGQPIAVIDSPEGKALQKEELLAPASLGLDTQNILKHLWQSTIGSDGGEQTTWLHTNHLGAPEAATDASGQLIWQASYAPFGAAKIIKASTGKSNNSTSLFSLNLRLPGQYEDAETGLHYNKQRYYDPARGEYLTPDPLGTPDGPNGYSYVRYNPLKYVDPDGLILFAFDGTGNDESNARELSNVVNFRGLYQEDRFYITGPGTTDPRTGIENPWYKGGNAADMGFSYTGKARIARLILDLQRHANGVDDKTAVDIDAIGFSRGAAQARDFANQVAANTRAGWYSYRDDDGKDQCQKVNFRFMGLWDTVLSTHSGSYSLGIPAEFKHVSQAIALNEYRGLFPSESILGGVVPAGQTRNERGFLGSHSDIGGSFANGDLARVALVWMVDQAKMAGVSMTEPDRTIIANPVLHDKSSNLYAASGPAPTATSEDRRIRFGDGLVQRQRTAAVDGMRYEDTVPFINYSSAPAGGVAGTVDMRAYLKWLDDHGYGVGMTVN